METQNFIDKAYIYQMLCKIDDLLAISDESTEHEIAKLTESLNADEQKELMNDYIVQNFFDLESAQQQPKFIIKFLSLYKISGD